MRYRSPRFGHTGLPEVARSLPGYRSTSSEPGSPASRTGLAHRRALRTKLSKIRRKLVGDNQIEANRAEHHSPVRCPPAESSPAVGHTLEGSVRDRRFTGEHILAEGKKIANQDRRVFDLVLNGRQVAVPRGVLGNLASQIRNEDLHLPRMLLKSCAIVEASEPIESIRRRRAICLSRSRFCSTS